MPGQLGSVRGSLRRKGERIRVPPGKLLYTTSFAGTENPLSESGFWLGGLADGLDWTNCSKTPGLCIGEHSNTVDFTDPTAIINPAKMVFPPNQAAQAVVFSQNQNNTFNQEVELRLRSNISAHVNTGYEIYWRCLGNDSMAYYAVTRWNGPYNDFTQILFGSGTNVGVVNGDTVRAEIIDDTIYMYKNNALVDSVVDTVWATGNPGLGFYVTLGHASTKADFGFTSYFCEDIAT